jgi:hypothetical protein
LLTSGTCPFTRSHLGPACQSYLPPPVSEPDFT